jgi:uncharacterized protein YecE (DUF72 family)
MGYTKDMIYFGISGFSYYDWVGNFYPVGMPKQEWLTNCAREVNNCQVNSTIYALPKSYDYSYTTRELSEWLLKIQKLDSIAGKNFIFANNHWHGLAESNTRQLRVMLD